MSPKWVIIYTILSGNANNGTLYYVILVKFIYPQIICFLLDENPS